MAKKKLTHQSNSSNHTQKAPQPQPQPQSQSQPQPQHFTHSLKSSPSTMTMDDPSEKLQSLKNLNSLLLKETAERRQQVDSLVEAKEALESAFNRSAMEQKLLEAHLSDAAEDNLALELEKAVVFVFVEAQMREMGFRFERLVAERNEMESAVTERGSEIAFLKGEVEKLKLSLESEGRNASRLSREKQETKNDFDGLVAEANLLTEKLIETENRERKLREEVQKLRLEGEKLMVEGYQKERAIGELKVERDLALKNSAESARMTEKLRGEMEVVMREKNETEEVNNAQELKITGLESELQQLNESSENSRREEELMRLKILNLEGSLGLALEKEKEMAMEIRALLKQKEEMEQSIEILTERRDSIQKVLDMVQRELEDKQHEIDETIRAKYEIEQVKVSCETEITELQREVERLKDVVHELKKSCRDFEEENKQLLSEVNHYEKSVDEVVLERDNIRKGYDEEKNKVKSLMLQVAGMEKKIEQTVAELGQIRSEREKLIEKNEMMESHIGNLMKEKDALQQSLLESQRVSDDLRAKIEFCCINSNQALAMLKSTATLVCQYKDSVEEVNSNEQKKPEEEIQPYAEQLDAIRNAFRNKNKTVADMKQQVASLQNSVAEAHKMKNLWTVISSATTILAAALAAYVARGR